MTVPLSFQCKTCYEFFEWTEEFRKPDSGAPCCSKCLAEWNTKNYCKKSHRELVSRQQLEQVEAQKRLSWERAQARRAAEREEKRREREQKA